MRLFATVYNDIRYQIKYGFYTLYAFISTVYILILSACPLTYKKAIASVIIFTDPAMLGMFFIGGIWLLEKGEGIHQFWVISPLRSMEYIFSKAISLGLISTVSAYFISFIALRTVKNHIILLFGVLIGSMIFTIIGMLFASKATTLNQYVIYVTPPSAILTLPPILIVFGITHPFLEIFPSTALWRIIAYSIGMTNHLNIWVWVILLLWLVIVVVSANLHIPAALHFIGGEKV